MVVVMRCCKLQQWVTRNYFPLHILSLGKVDLLYLIILQLLLHSFFQIHTDCFQCRKLPRLLAIPWLYERFGQNSGLQLQNISHHYCCLQYIVYFNKSKLSRQIMSVTLNPALISNLNEFKFLPIAITKLIVDQTFQSIYSSSKGINEDTLQRIISVEVKTSCQWRSAIKSLKFLIKYAIKNQYPAKAIGVFLTEKTLLMQEIAQYICQKYEQFSKEKVQPPKQARLEEVSWAACNLKQNRNKQIVNKMYMKVYMRTLENGREQEKVVNCQLPEFKLFMAEISEIGSNMR